MNIQSLWQSENHSAFTDLCYANGSWYCVFREGTTHMSLDGKIIVLKSMDAKLWRQHSEMSWQGGDLRDPKLSVSPGGVLILSAGIRWAVYNTRKSRLYSVGWHLKENGDWSAPVLDQTSEGSWRWAPTWHKGTAYSVGYGAEDIQGCLYESKDGLHWQAVLKPFFPDTGVFTNESTLVSDNETLWCLSRRDAAGGAKAILGKAILTNATRWLKNWQWQTVSKAIGGPKLIKLSNGEWLLAARRINYKRWSAKTVLYKLNPKSGRLKVWRELPSAGDSSYAGMVEKEGKLYISYYSCHLNGQSNIFLAVIALIKTKRSRTFL